MASLCFVSYLFTIFQVEPHYPLQKQMVYSIVFAILFLLLVLNQCKANKVLHQKNIKAKQYDISSCNLFQGSWEYNDAYNPYYNTSTCPFLIKEFDCQENGRPDQLYLKYRWKPTNCDLPRFNGQRILKKYTGKKIMFVGDSLSLDQWQSMTCMLHASVPQSSFTLSYKGSISMFSIQDYNISVMLYRTPYLVDVVSENIGRILKLDSIEIGNAWKGMDMLIFNSWHWWLHTGTKNTGWDYIQVGDQIYKDMDRLTAFKLGLTTWSKWVETNTNPKKTKVFFQNISPTHYQSKEWNVASGTCKGETTPMTGSTYPAGLPPAVDIVNQVLSTTSAEIMLLDITTLSQLRKDGHPSIYGSNGDLGNDCSHWCLPGVPDTWNELLYALIFSDQPKKRPHSINLR